MTNPTSYLNIKYFESSNHIIIKEITFLIPIVDIF